jgi:signal transduction histidine kinase
LAEEQERRRLATALHDRVAQTLALSKMKLGMLREPASSTDLAESVDEIYKLLEQAIQDTRSLIFEISSPILYHFGLEAAVEWLTEQTQKQYGILFEFRDDRQPKPLDEDVRVLLFQAVRELLVNVGKHAQARSVKVALRRDGNDIQITVEDDGVGFDAFPIGSHWSEIKGFGLFSIRERLDHVGGQLKIKSEPGHGTRVTLVAPLSRDETTTRKE